LLVSLPLGTAFADDAFKPSAASPSETALATIFTIVISAIFIIVCVLLNMRTGIVDDDDSMRSGLVLTAVLAVAIRVIVALIYEGYTTDIGCFKGWAIATYESGPSHFYTSGIFADYPPGYMYVLWVLGFLRELFAIDANGALFTLIIKLPSIAAEVIAAVFVFKTAKKEMGKTFALLCAAFLLFNPALFFNSSVWGQVDAFFTLFAVLIIYHLRNDNPWLGAVFFAFALLIKPQAIMLLPVVGLYYLFALFKKDKLSRGVKGLIGGLAIGAAVFALGVLPFTGDQPITWIFEKYVGTVKSYPYASINAFNLFALTGANWRPSEAPLWFFNYQTWGIIFIVLICVAVVFLQWRSREQGRLFDMAAFLIISVFMLAHSMHDRYILPACVFLLFAYVYSRDGISLFFSAAFSVTALLNQMVVLYADSVLPPQLPTLLISGVNVLLYIMYAMITFKKLSSSKVLIKSPALKG
jgi:Gpi18-like mannosyltransferase